MADVGQHREALEPAKRATDTYEKLAETNPDAYLPNLAMSLNNYAILLAENGRQDEAVLMRRRAQEIEELLGKDG